MTNQNAPEAGSESSAVVRRGIWHLECCALREDGKECDCGCKEALDALNRLTAGAADTVRIEKLARMLEWTGYAPSVDWWRFPEAHIGNTEPAKDGDSCPVDALRNWIDKSDA